MVSTPAREVPEFPAALSFLPSLTPMEAIEALSGRVAGLAYVRLLIEDLRARRITWPLG